MKAPHIRPAVCLFNMREALSDVPFRLMADSDDLKSLAPDLPWNYEDHRQHVQ
jgi:hypothetical protein